MLKEKSWQQEAECKGLPVDIFFADSARDQKEAKKICATCAVSVECLAFAIESDCKFGIFGGLNHEERKNTRKVRAILASRECIDSL